MRLFMYVTRLATFANNQVPNGREPKKEAKKTKKQKKGKIKAKRQSTRQKKYAAK